MSEEFTVAMWFAAEPEQGITDSCRGEIAAVLGLDLSLVHGGVHGLRLVMSTTRVPFLADSPSINIQTVEPGHVVEVLETLHTQHKADMTLAGAQSAIEGCASKYEDGELPWGATWLMVLAPQVLLDDWQAHELAVPGGGGVWRTTPSGGVTIRRGFGPYASDPLPGIADDRSAASWAVIAR